MPQIAEFRPRTDKHFAANTKIRFGASLPPQLEFVRSLFGALIALTCLLTSPAHAVNFVTFVLDDLSLLEFNRDVMPRTFSDLVDKGVNFTNMTVSTSLCGPSRSGIHTGKFAHNHGFIVCQDESPPGLWDSYAQKGNLPLESGPRFQALGYYTAMLGKYSSSYGSPEVMSRAGLPVNYVPSGWNAWLALTGHGTNYSNWKVNDNGSIRTETQFPSDYLAIRAAEAIDAAIAQQKPFFINVWPQNPHASTDKTYPDRLDGLFADASVPQGPDFFSDPSTRHPALAVSTPASPARVGFVNIKYRERLRSSRAADEMIGAVIDKLTSAGQIDSTVLIVTSDNGYMLGHYRLFGKMAPYHRSVSVPLAIRGPQIPIGVRNEVVQQIDLLPTQLELAGAQVTNDIDGQSLSPLLMTTGAVPWRRWALVESWSTAVIAWVPGVNIRYRFRSLVGSDWKYILWDDGFEEYYTDRQELVNRVSELTPMQRQLFRARANQRFGCIGAACREWVSPSGSVTELMTGTNPSNFGQSVTLSATVSSLTGTPTGSVEFFDGATSLGVGTLSAGIATLSTSALSLGEHSLSAVYSGANYSGSSSASVTQTVGVAQTTVALVSSANPALGGQSVSLTAQATSSGGTPTGAIEFFDGPTSLGSAPLVAGIATITVSALSVGAHEFTATYAGDVGYSGSSAPGLTQTVVDPVTSTTLISSVNPSNYTQSVTLTASVSSLLGTPTGSIEFVDGATSLGVVALADGAASLTTNALSLGAHSLTAVYAGDGVYAGSTSPSVEQTVEPAETTGLTLVSLQNPSVYGRPVILSATITSGAGAPGGTVEFFDGATVLGIATLSGGTATLSTSALSVGTRSLTAVYADTRGFLGSTSPSITQIVDPAPTTTSLSTAESPSVHGQSITLTSTVASDASEAPSGSVEFFDGSTSLGTASLSGGTASLTTNAFSIGAHSLTAAYSGETRFLASTSTTFEQIVSRANATIDVSPSASRINPGHSVTLTATASATAPASGTPTGSVTFFRGTTELGSFALNGAGVAICTTPNLAAGLHRFTASYGGSTEFNPSSSPTSTVVADYRVGPQIRIASVSNVTMTNPAAATGADGNILALWERTPASGPPSIRGRIVSALDGALLGAEIGVAISAPGVGRPQAAGLVNGDYAVIWHADGAPGAGREIWLQLIAPNGAPRGPASMVNLVTTGDQAFPAIAARAAGGFVVTWQTAGEDLSGYGIVAQLFDNSGARLGSTISVNTRTAGDQAHPAVLALPNGEFVIAWGGTMLGGYSAYFQRFDLTGSKAGPETRITGPALISAPQPKAGALGSDSFFLLWSKPESVATSPHEVYFQRYNAGGVRQGAVLRVDLPPAAAKPETAVAPMDGGRFVVSWTAPDSDLDGLKVQPYQLTASRIGVPFIANSQQLGSQHGPALAPLGVGTELGKFYVALWSSQSGNSAESVFLQRFVSP